VGVRDADDDLACGLVLILIPIEIFKFPSFLVGENEVSSSVDSKLFLGASTPEFDL
jgi:hypothetical protein